MKTLAERLKYILNRRGISQAEAARMCGVSQQAINYIITNNLKTSKLALQIANNLQVNPEWLIYEKGRFNENKVYELPIIESPYQLEKLLDNSLNTDTVRYAFLETQLDDENFAYLISLKEMLICFKSKNPSNEYLNFVDSSVQVSNERKGVSFNIFERRIRKNGF